MHAGSQVHTRLAGQRKAFAFASHRRARALQAGPVHANLTARRATEGLPAPAAGLAADLSLAAGDAA
eukprot:scaffold14337_cov60-Phaeocystis_antarctica.AAC.2